MKNYKEYIKEILNDKDIVSEKIDYKKANLLRTNMPGYVGSDFAKKATDEDLLKMANLRDEYAKVFNQSISPIIKSINDLRKKYKLNSDKYIK